jgi:hypothetical protein
MDLEQLSYYLEYQGIRLKALSANLKYQVQIDLEHRFPLYWFPGDRTWSIILFISSIRYGTWNIGPIFLSTRGIGLKALSLGTRV